MVSPAKLLNQAKNAAGDQAVAEHERGNYQKSREWRVIAYDCDRLFRDAIRLAAGEGDTDG